MKLALRHTEEQLQHLVDQERRAEECNRLRTVLFAKQGFTAPEIATCTGFSRRTVQEWVARYNRANELVCPSNITLLRLPPYSPELNPVENLWHYLRSHHWSNRKYDTVDDLFEAAVTAWRATCLDPNLIRTVCRAAYAETRS